MFKQLCQKARTGVILCSALGLAQPLMAQENYEDAFFNLLSEQNENIVTEDVQRELFQDMKNFFGLTELKRIETQNVMRLMLPPYIDTTMTTGARVGAAEQSIRPWHETLVRDTANYNINTPASDSSDTAILSERIRTDGNDLRNPYQGLNDLLASSLLSGLAFNDDADANDAYQYIRNLTNFNPIESLEYDEIFADPEGTILTDKGARHLMAIYKQLPTMSLAQNSLLAIHSEKQRFTDFAEGLPIGNPDDQGASLMEVLAYEVERRYMSPDWYQEMNQMSEAGLLREMANMMAFQMYLDFKRYEQNQRMEAMMAGQIGILSGFLAMMNVELDLDDLPTGF